MDHILQNNYFNQSIYWCFFLFSFRAQLSVELTDFAMLAAPRESLLFFAECIKLRQYSLTACLKLPLNGFMRLPLNIFLFILPHYLITKQHLINNGFL